MSRQVLHPSSPETAPTGGDLVADALLSAGIDTVFALPGIQLDHLFNAFYPRRNALRIIHPRHEQGAAYMAFGYAEASGRIGTFAVVPGPGLLNAGAALSTAYACRSPVLGLIGQIRSDMIGAQRGELHELTDQSAIVEGLSRWNALVLTPSSAGSSVAMATDALTNGLARPAVVELPPDILAAPACGQKDEQSPLEPAVRPHATRAEIDKAVAILREARAPLIAVGRGAIHAATQVAELAHRLGSPVMSEGRARGILPDSDPLSVGMLAGRVLWQEADVVVLIGGRARHAMHNWKLRADQKLIQIDIDRSTVGSVYSAAAGLNGDSVEILDMLLPAIDWRVDHPERAALLAARKAQAQADFRERLAPQMEWIDALRAALPDDGVMVTEYTQIGYVAAAAFPVERPGTLITPGYQGTLGFGFATALGAKVALPDREVISINGDGGFLFTATELATAVRHRIGVIAIVFNDGYFTNVRRMQEEQHGGRVLATDLHNPDFVSFARSFGAQACRAETPQALAEAIVASRGRDVPTLIEVPMPSVPDPWPLLRPR